jgi:hypothetical protein
MAARFFAGACISLCTLYFSYLHVATQASRRSFAFTIVGALVCE